MIGDLTVQTFDPLNLLLRGRLLNWGIRKKDREVNRQIKVYKEWGRAIIGKRTEEIRRKLKEG